MLVWGISRISCGMLTFRPSPPARIPFLAAVLAILAGVPGCRGQSVLLTQIDGREVQATIHGPGSISVRDDTGVISFDGGSVTVARDRILLGGEELIRVQPDVKRLELEITARRLRVMADGEQVLSRALPR